MNRDWEEVTIDKDNSVWDRQEPLEGLYKGFEDNVGPKKSKLYTVLPEGGEEVKFWGSTVLDNKLMGVPVGTYLRIEYTGLTKGKSGNEYHDFKVFLDKNSKPEEAPKGATPEVFPDAEDLDKPVDLSAIPF